MAGTGNGSTASLGFHARARNYQTALLIIILSVIIFLTARSYLEIARDLTDATLSRRESVSYLAATTLAEKFDRLSDIGVSLATRVRFRALVSSRKWDEAIEILKSVPQDFPVIERLFLTDPEGTLMADAPAFSPVKGMNFSDRDWYKGVSAEWKPYVSNVYTRAAAPRLNVIAAAIPIRGPGQQVSGILVLQLKLETFFGWISGIDIGEHGLVYVVDRKGTVAFHPHLPPQGTLTDFSMVPAARNALHGELGVKVLFDPMAGDDRLAAYAPVARYGWGVVAQQPAHEAFAARDGLLRRVLVAYVLTLALFIGVVFLVVRVLIQRQQGETMRRSKAELERRVAERTAQLEAANKELESFSYSVSHDLRSPLRAIDGFARMLDEDYRDKLDDEAKRRIGVIRDSGARMAQLIDDLLAFSRTNRQSIAASDIDMTALARNVFDELRAGMEGRVPRFVIQPMPAAWGDPGLVRQVWTNLLSNAIKFTSRKPDPVIEVGAQVNRDETIYHVKDNGAGFDMAYYDKLFGVFQRLHTTSQFPGTGVGLAIVQRIVTRHGGRAWADGRLDEGATFYFTLPAAGSDGGRV